jgi:hypothetical protein
MWEDESDSFSKCKLPIILGLSFGCAIGILLEVLACVYFSSGWWLIIVIFIFGFMPLPRFWSRSCGDDPLNPTNTWKIISNFWTGILAGSGIALPLMLAHAKYIR